MKREWETLVKSLDGMNLLTTGAGNLMEKKV